MIRTEVSLLDKIQDYTIIEELAFYGSFFEKCKIPFINPVLSLLRLVNFRLDAKEEMKTLHIAALSYFQENIKTVSKTDTYIKAIEKIGNENHFESEFNLNVKIFSSIFGVDVENCTDFRTAFLSNQLNMSAFNSTELQNQCTKEQFEEKIAQIFSVKTKDATTPITLDFFLNKYKEAYTIIKMFVFNLHKYTFNCAKFNISTVVNLFRNNSPSQLVVKSKDFGKEKFNAMLEFDYKEFANEKYEACSDYISNFKLIESLSVLYDTVLKPFEGVTVFISDTFVKIKANLSLPPSEMAGNLKDFLMEQYEYLKEKIGDGFVAIYQKESNLVITIKKSICSLDKDFFLNLLGSLRKLTIKQAYLNMCEMYKKWISGETTETSKEEEQIPLSELKKEQ